MLRASIPTVKYAYASHRLAYTRSPLVMASASHSSSSTARSMGSTTGVRIVAYEDVKLRTSRRTEACNTTPTHLIPRVTDLYIHITLQDIHVIDVREPHEVVEGHIPSAKNIPLSILTASLHLDPAAFKARVGHEKPLEHHEIVFYCRSGRRAGVACEVALKHGFKKYVHFFSVLRRESGIDDDATLEAW